MFKKSYLMSAAALCIVGTAATADQVILDDLIVDGSLCVGLDCVNGESFGFDTIRMKENNLRIKAQDTSASASFPSNDWQLTFNDSSNGGANKFSIDDIDGGRTPFTIEASAPSHSLYVDDGGRIGVGTSTPVVEVHIADGDTPTLRLEQNGSSGFTPQTWDVAGNETNFFVRDVTNGSKLSFKIKPNAPDNSLFVAASGNIGMNTASPSANLHVRTTSGSISDEMVLIEDATSAAGLRDLLLLKNNGGVIMGLENTNVGQTWFMLHENSAPNRFLIQNDSNANSELALDVNGNLEIAGTLTVNGFGGAGQSFPDYVFEADYDLMPLAEVRAFIDENGHLPKIPNAQEVAENGLNMTNLQISLLEKVEELTLYTLEQQDTIAVLTARLEALEEN